MWLGTYFCYKNIKAGNIKSVSFMDYSLYCILSVSIWYLYSSDYEQGKIVIWTLILFVLVMGTYQGLQALVCIALQFVKHYSLETYTIASDMTSIHDTKIQ